jgi:hypothetical protein
MSNLFDPTRELTARHDPQFKASLLPDGDVLAGSPACGFQKVMIIGYTDQDGVVIRPSARAGTKSRSRTTRVGFLPAAS